MLSAANFVTILLGHMKENYPWKMRSGCCSSPESQIWTLLLFKKKGREKKGSQSYLIDSVDNVCNSVETYWCKRADMHGVHALLMVNERKRKISKKKKKKCWNNSVAAAAEQESSAEGSSGVRCLEAVSAYSCFLLHFQKKKCVQTLLARGKSWWGKIYLKLHPNCAFIKSTNETRSWWKKKQKKLF